MSSACQSSEGMVPCETCDETFDHQQAMRAHHTLKHGESLTDKTCKECEEEFYSPRESQQFCSRKCKSESQIAKEIATCDCCYAELTIRPCRRRRYRSLYCSERCKGIAERTHFGYGDTLHRHSRPSDFRELVRHAYFHEGHTFEATCRIVTVELEGEFSEKEIADVVEDLKRDERNIRHRVWALRPEDLGLAPEGEVGY